MTGKSKNHDGTYSIEVVEDNGWIYWRNEQGQVHREDGPAIMRPDGDMEYWFRDGYAGNPNKLEELVKAARKEFFERSMTSTKTEVKLLSRLQVNKRTAKTQKHAGL